MLALACGDDDDKDDNDTDAPDVDVSTVDGRLDLATFGAAPASVDAVDELDARVSSPLAADGAFTLQLRKGHVYKLVVLVAPGEVPIVFPRPDSRLDRSFRLSTGNAIVSLGTVRHFASKPETGVTAEEVLQPSCAAGVDTSGDRDGDDDDDDEDDDDNDDASKKAPPSIPEEDADPAMPFAVPDRNAPNDVTGCKD